MTLSERQRWGFDAELSSKYEILEALGGGGMGRVLRARHRQLKRSVAIKLLQHDLKASDAVARFLREARAAAQIRSAHVAHVMDAGILRNGQPYIVMEYLQGQDLASLIASGGRLSALQAVSFVLQALEAIAEAHSLQIIHRDIKPGNLFATRIAGGETFIKVVDFGLAKTNQALDTLDPGLTERGAVLGTPSYMSPEQFVDAQNVDARADIWGMGATLFELLTGIPPFSGTNLAQLYTAVMYRPIPSVRASVPELPEGLDEVVATCLTRERELRYADVAELASALEPYGGDAARDHVERIQRVVTGARQSLLDTEPSAEALEPTGTPDVPETQPGSISSTFARRRSEHAAQSESRAYAVPRFRLHPFWLSLLAFVLLATTVAWAFGASRAAPSANPQRPIGRPRIDTPRPTGVAPTLAPDLQRAAAAETTPPDAAVSSGHAGFVSIPAREATSRSTTTNRTHRQKSDPPATPKPASSSMYERYP